MKKTDLITLRVYEVPLKGIILPGNRRSCFYCFIWGEHLSTEANRPLCIFNDYR